MHGLRQLFSGTGATGSTAPVNATTPSHNTRGSKRSATDEQLVPATAPAVKLHKDSSGDVLTAATVTAGVPTDAVDTAQVAQATLQVPQSEWQALVARVSVLGQQQQQLTASQSQLAAALTAAEASYDKKLQEQTQSSIARENAIKDSYRQQLADLESTVEFLNQRARGKNMVLHGVPDTAAVSKPAELERFVKGRIDDATPGRGPSAVSQSITAVTHIGRPGDGNRAVLVEYASNQAKHKAYALSRELRRQGFHLADELTPKQLQSQKAMEPDCTALRSKGYRPWFRRGALWYSNQGVPRQCKKGDALTVPAFQGTAPPARAPGFTPRVPSRRPASSPRRDNGVTAPHVPGSQRPTRSGSPSYAHVTRSDPATGVADPLPGPPAAPGASTATPVSAAAPAPLGATAPAASVQVPSSSPSPQ